MQRMQTKRILIAWGFGAITLGSILGLLRTQEAPEAIPSVEFEPIPAYSITTTMSSQIEEAAEAAVDQITLEVEQGTITKEDPESNEDPQIGEDAQELMMRVAQAEAGNQGEDGMWLVLCVIWNRAQSPTFPSTIPEVIRQENAFSTVSNGAFKRVNISQEVKAAMERIKAGYIAPEIVAFERKGSTELEKYFEKAFDYKDHTFYVEKSK